MADRRLVTILGARPQFVKAGVVSRAIAATGRLEELLVHTGQHFDANMSDLFFDELGIPAPRHHLDIHGGSHGAMTGRMLGAIEEVLLDEKPDGVIVYGDTNSTIAGALAAAKLGIPVFHVEAGLRSYLENQPEEINRILTDRISTLLFCPSQLSVRQLAAEGITRGVIDAGDVMAEVAAETAGRVRGEMRILDSLGIKDGAYAVATIHRQENTGSTDDLRRVFDFIHGEADGLPIVVPLHPRTRNAVRTLGVSLERFKVVDPVGYRDMTRLLLGAKLVLTDSGGLQKEAYWHRVPCITLRDATEWQETIDSGWNRLWTEKAFKEPRRLIPELDRIDASGVIAARIVDFFDGHIAPASPVQSS